MQISQLKETRSEVDRTLDFKTLDFHITLNIGKVNTLQKQNEVFRAENGKIKQHYKELYDSIKITRVKHIEQKTALLTEKENLKVQIHNKMQCVTTNPVKPRVIASGKYAIDVEPIPPRNRNNRKVHLDYLKHLKESVETIREIVEEAKVERPLDRSLASACLYTKHSQELLEYVIGTCPKDFNQRDKKHKTNIPVPPSTGVNSCTDASGSQPRSNTKKNRILPAKSVNKKNVEEHPRTNKSNLKTKNHVDSSISSKRHTDRPLVFGFMQLQKHMMGDSLTGSRSGNISCLVRRYYGEVVATACYTQNRSLIHTLHNKTPYELVHDKKPDLTFFHVFGALCYPTNDSEDLGKLQPTTDIGIFVGYAPSRKGYRIYNKRTRRIMETIHVQFDELTEQMAPVQLSTGPAPTHSAGTIPLPATTIDQDAPSPSHSPSSSALQSPSIHQGVAAESTLVEENPFTPVDNDPFINIFAPEPTSEALHPGMLVQQNQHMSLKHLTSSPEK
ncbi:retrovirus-related pol polyprotein from transposon TNT 1-94 [Tanacetum coccineum]